MRPLWGRAQGDRGSAVVEYVLVAPLLVAVALGVLQLALSAYIRSSLASAAAQGARAAALAGADAQAGERRVRSLVEGSLAGSSIDDISVNTSLNGGVPSIEVRVDATIPGLGLLGAGAMSVHGHAVREDFT